MFTADELATIRQFIVSSGTGPLSDDEVDEVHRRLYKPPVPILPPPVLPSGDPPSAAVENGNSFVTRNELAAILKRAIPQFDF